MDILVMALFLALAANRIVEGIVAPIKQKFPQIDFWWLLYVAWVVGGVLGWLSEINLFAAYLPNVLAGRILSAVVIGGGANLIKDIFNKGKITEFVLPATKVNTSSWVNGYVDVHGTDDPARG